MNPRVIRTPLALIVIALLFAWVPVFTHAEVESELRSTIQAELMSDPAAQELSSEELAEIVEALMAEAYSQGVTAAEFRDVSFEDVVVAVQAEETCMYPAFICAANEAFGFSGNDTRLPITLGAAAGALAIILLLILTRRHYHERMVGGGS